MGEPMAERIGQKTGKPPLTVFYELSLDHKGFKVDYLIFIFNSFKNVNDFLFTIKNKI